MTKKAASSPSISSFAEALNKPLPGTGLTLSGLLLGLLAVFGAIPIVRYFLMGYIVEPVMLGTVTILLSALLVYYLLLSETHSQWLSQHPLAFILIVLGLIMLAYGYVPHFKEMLGTAGEMVSQAATLLVRP